MKKAKDEKSIRITTIFERLKQRMETVYSAQGVTVYMLSSGTADCIVGEKIDNTVIERYMSFNNTIVLRSPVGLQEDKSFKSRVVTQLNVEGTIYLVIISSYVFEAFKHDITLMIEDIISVGKEVEIA